MPKIRYEALNMKADTIAVIDVVGQFAADVAEEIEESADEEEDDEIDE